MTTDTEVPTTPPVKAARWEDFVDAIFSPRDVFARRADEGWFKPFAILCLISIILYYVFISTGEMMWQAAISENSPPTTTPEQLQQSVTFMKYLGGVFVPFMYFFLIALTAVGLKLASAILEPSARWREAFVISTYAHFVLIVQQIATNLSLFLASRGGPVEIRDASFGPLRFIEDSDRLTQAVLGRFDLFAIWIAVLCAVGLVVIVRMPKAKAAVTALAAWAIVALPPLVGAILSGGDQ